MTDEQLLTAVLALTDDEAQLQRLATSLIARRLNELLKPLRESILQFAENMEKVKDAQS